MYRIGHSFDTHRLVENRDLILGGVKIPYHLGLLGHSDADCLLHAITEAFIGAMGMGDLGTFFPDTDLVYKDKQSSFFLLKIKELMVQEKYQISNIDATVFLEKPHLHSYIEDIRNNIASLLEIDKNNVNIKATRGEGLGYIGRGEGISAEAVVLIYKN